MSQYKHTVLLPETDFAMKADLATREPKILARWKSDGLYAKILARPARGRFVFHDGPPYANGGLHYGHVLNNVLKDFVTRFRNLAGETCRMVPGWDCHGLPIELNVDRELRRKNVQLPPAKVRELCRKEAEKWVAVQSDQRQRLGMLGTWDAPYLTMNRGYEAAVVQAMRAFVDQDIVYRGKKPVQWCANDRTALAEAEVEYIEAHVSPSVYVKFAATEATANTLRQRFPSSRAATFHAVIWTTTPWTLPANLAIAVHPDVAYVVVDVVRDGVVEGWLIAEPLVAPVLAATHSTGEMHVANTRDEGRGIALVGLAFRHPWEDRDSALVDAMYVETTAGTGLVHTAPGHGRDDYNTGLRNGLEAYAPLDDAGRFTDELGAASKAMGLVGLTVWEANPRIVAEMATRGILANRPGASITHKYPGCWRCHQPLITRATVQWFIDLNKPLAKRDHGKSLKTRALEEIDRIADEGKRAAADGAPALGWVPTWGRDRIFGMIEARPDWCISRQRVWGVPIPALHCAKCGEAELSTRVLDHVAKVFGELGSDAWFDPAAPVVPPGFSCRKCGSDGPFERDASIVDVWFESGASFQAVCADQPDLGVPTDLYLEGSDQHRGWFHSALLVSVAMYDAAPYRTVVTHGWVQGEVDEKIAAVMREHKLADVMSKSTLKVLEEAGLDVSAYRPDTMVKTQGAEILRAWTAYEDYRADVPLSREHLAQVADAYRRVRNTFRFMLAALRKQPAPVVETAALEPIDRATVAQLAALVSRSERAYRDYEFRTVFIGAVEFMTELSASYLDAVKDWLYNDAADSARRRSTLATLDLIVRSMAVVLAPILPFTAEDVWDHLPRREGDATSVHLAAWPQVSAPVDAAVVQAAAGAVRGLRARLHAALEPRVAAWGDERRAAKAAGREPGGAIAPENRIEHASDALAVLTVTADEMRLLTPVRATLSEQLVLGAVELVEGTVPAATVRVAPFERCERCRRRRGPLDAEKLCDRCRDAVDRFGRAART